MSDLAFRRLQPFEPADLLEFQRVFRDAPSFVFLTEGRIPMDADAERIMRTLPVGKTSSDAFIFAIYSDGTLCGCAYLVRGYPRPEVAYLVLLLLVEAFQHRFLGVEALQYIEALAQSWGCTTLCGAVDSKNERAVAFWQRYGARELYRTQLSGLVGEGIVMQKGLSSNPFIKRTATSLGLAVRSCRTLFLAVWRGIGSILWD